MAPTSKRITLYNHPHYKVDLEYNEEFAILHLPKVTRFSKGTIADMREQFCGVYDFFKQLGYDGIWAAIEPDNKRTINLAKMFGFEYKGSSDGFSVFHMKE